MFSFSHLLPLYLEIGRVEVGEKEEKWIFVRKNERLNVDSIHKDEIILRDTFKYIRNVMPRNNYLQFRLSLFMLLSG